MQGTATGGLQIDARPRTAAPTAVHDDSARVAALDGLRGVLAMMVCISHYFGEVAHGVSGLMFAWIAVKMFFVLSGFLMARIILERMSCANFFSVFYIRRACRTLPVYLVTLLFAFASAAVFHAAPWMEPERMFPLWSYLTFTQGFMIVATGSFGSEWLIPTWTLTVEEQFYLIAPLFCLLVPRRHLIEALIAAAVASMLFRVLAYGTGTIPAMAGLVLLPAICHAMFFGMIAAVWLHTNPRVTPRMDLLLRIAPIAILGAVFLLKLADGKDGLSFELIGVPLVALGCAVYIASIVRDAPEAARLKSKRMRFLGGLSYGIYLLHMPVLGLLHGLLLDAKPDIATVAQVAVTSLAVAATVLLAWIVNVTIEAPLIVYGRSWKWRRALPLALPTKG